ncbi:Tk.4 [Vibrio phage nt-1]|uniref:Tk.4 n=1 Tax=Vibrio phage nt-1 TaxID=115992 RepID=R9TJ73_9CAUD|nr:Tk.4 [Vibrio phage nt-1]AGN30142.2 Tk.4 [Vibrio phage nt-1]
MITREISGDIVATLAHTLMKPKADKRVFIGQGCNCFIRQGSGIAGQLRQFPEIFQADEDYGRFGDPMKLGEFSRATLGVNPLDPDAVVYNMYTQFSMGTNERHVEYSAIKQAVKNVCLDMLDCGDEPLYLPLIGAGLAGGDWEIIRNVIHEASGKQAVVIVHFDQGRLLDW